MTKTVARTCTELPAAPAPGTDSPPKPLADYRSVHAYVLLGDPGSGKTTAFQAESEALGDQALFIAARDLLLHTTAPHELAKKTLFIDGLDEVRAGGTDPRTPFDRIRALLIQLGRPRFRISCRGAAWLGGNDRDRLGYAVRDSRVTVLRLDPLTKADIHEILRDGIGVVEPDSFVRQAREAGLEGLLDNPQTLGLLARAVGQGNRWPTGRQQVFDLACREMACERNPEHLVAEPNGPSTDSVIDCAGRLSALLLISDMAGYSPDDRVASEHWIPRDPYGRKDQKCLRAAVDSQLFRADSEGCLSPVHRQIAEFLGAKHLARLIAKGLSPRRVLALMTGADGVAVTALRGMSAWLATHSKTVRTELIGKNPVDVGLYGDLSTFSGDDKRQVLRALMAQPMSLARAFSPKRFSPLAAAEIEPQICKVLRSADRGPKQQVRVRFLFWLLAAGERLPHVANVVLGIVRDSSWPTRVREAALDALVHYKQDSPGGDEELRALLEEFGTEGISIANRDLCGTLLRALYPGTVGPSQVWDYFTHLGSAGPWGRYLRFWRRDLIAQSTTIGVAELLDTLAASIARLEPTIDALRLRHLPLEMLQRGLQLHGESADIDRVSAWLGTCARVAEVYTSNPPESLSEIRAWLESHPSVQKQVVLAGLEARWDGDNVAHADFNNRKRLVGAKLPADFGRWCLSQAVRLTDTKPEVAKYLFLESYRALKTPDVAERLSLEILQERARQHPLLEAVLREVQAPAPGPRHGAPWQHQQAAYVAELEKEREQLLAIVLSHRSRLLENRAHPELLHRLALVYFGEASSLTTGLFGEGAIARALRDVDAVDAAMHGLRRCVDRDDLPSAREIIRLARDSREHYISLPLQACLQERQKSLPGFLVGLDNSRLRTCVACLHCWEPHFLEVEDANLAWYQALLDHRPELVSDVGVQCAAAALRRDGTISARFWNIVEGHEGNPAARNAVLGLLRTLPTRCNARQVEALDELLWTALRHGWQSDLLGLADEKLPKRGVDAGQRVRWLGLGLICDPSRYAENLAGSVRGKEPLVRHLARFLVHGNDIFSPGAGAWHSSVENLESCSLALIIRLIGRFFPPYEPQGFTVVSDDLRVSGFLSRVINALGSRPCTSASESLDSLLDDPGLSSWHALLSVARTAQRTLRRDAEYRHPTLQQACETLGNGRPANACDLAALTLDKLQQIARRIRTSNANEWGQYWNLGKHGKPSTPKVEGACRDALLAALRPLLPESVTVEPEGRQVNQNRADLVLTAGKFKIPVEVKRNEHADLWSAVQNQLIAKYTLDPATGGYGIYLVFWFGKEYQRQQADGTRPTAPQELTSLLRNSLTEDHSHKIEVCVIDVCRPRPSTNGGHRRSNSKG